MQDLPFHPVAAEVVDVSASGTTTVRAGELFAQIAAGPPGLGAELAATLTDESDDDVAVEIDALRAAAGREATRLAAPRIACEHVVLGFALLAGGQGFPDLGTARATLQQVIAGATGRAYETLVRDQGDVPRPCAVVLIGLPGSGKSTLAEAVAAALGATSWSLDWQLGALAPFGVLRADNARPVALQLVTAVLAQQLQRGASVVLDVGDHHRDSRARWQRVGANLGARFLAVECVCSDEEIHRSRLSERRRGIPGWPATVSWEQVERMGRRADPWLEPHLVVDTVRPLSDCVSTIVEAFGDTSDGGRRSGHR